MSAADLIALAERVEKAEGPDRELNARIACALLKDISQLAVLNTPDKWVKEALEQRWNVARFTASLDAAMTLVPEGWERTEQRSTQMSDGSVRHYAQVGYDTQPSRAATPALAFTAAALRARAAKEEGK